MSSNPYHTTIYLYETNNKLLQYHSGLVRSYTHARVFSVLFPSFWTLNGNEWIELCKLYAKSGPTILDSVYSIKIVDWSFITCLIIL